MNIFIIIAALVMACTSKPPAPQEPDPVPVAAPEQDNNAQDAIVFPRPSPDQTPRPEPLTFTPHGS
jgi:hypothetical protein